MITRARQLQHWIAVNKPSKRILIWLGVIAGLFYLSWPLAYFFNPNLAGEGLSSNLEVSGQPYNWLFILLDVTSGVIVLFICAALMETRHRKSNQLLVYLSLLGLAAFGSMTALGALIPLNCIDQPILSCGAAEFGSHDVTSMVAAVGLFIGLVLALDVMAKETHWHWTTSLVLYALVIWSVCGLFLLATILTDTLTAATQHVFISLTSALIALVPLALDHRHRRINRKHSQKFSKA